MDRGGPVEATGHRKLTKEDKKYLKSLKEANWEAGFMPISLRDKTKRKLYFLKKKLKSIKKNQEENYER